MATRSRGFCGPVAVLGSGIQGALVALELADRGVRVDLYEVADAPMTAASRWNEGKIHLGYLFANDPSGRTAPGLVDGAAAFSAMADRYIGRSRIEASRSSPFTYAVHADSLLSPEQVLDHARRVGEMVDANRARLGPAVQLQDAPLFERVSDAERSSQYDPATIIGAVRTPEVALNPHVVADAVTQAVLSHPRISFLGNHRVRQVTRETDGLSVHTLRANQEMARETYKHVVNALWANRLLIDAGLGLVPPRPWLFRYKLAAHARLSRPLPLIGSTTIVLGGFGDIVNFGEHLYLSWYPAGRIGSSTALAPPDWHSAVTPELKAATWESFRTELGRIDRHLAAQGGQLGESVDVQGGVIFSWGETDVSDPSGEIHQRHDIGPRTHDGYTSVDTGKWCMAPLFATETADRIAPAIRTYPAATSPPPAEIDVLIPAYNAEGFLQKALDSLSAQTFARFRAIISVDLSDDATAEVAHRHARNDHRFVVIEQVERQHWVGGFNALIERVTAPRFCFLFHDDQLEPNFLELLDHALTRHPTALGTSCRTLMHGVSDGVTAPEIRGTMVERLRKMVEQFGSSGNFVRGVLMHSRAIEAGLRMPEGYSPDGRRSVALYDVAVARMGEIVCEPNALYHKLMWQGSTTDAWRRKPPPTIKQRVTFLAAYLKVVLDCDIDAATKVELTGALTAGCGRQLKRDKAVPAGHDADRFAASLLAMHQAGVDLDALATAQPAALNATAPPRNSDKAAPPPSLPHQTGKPSSHKTQIRFREKAYSLCLPNRDEDQIQKFLADQQVPYEEEMLGDMIGRTVAGTAVLDVGANVGNHSIGLAAYTDCQIYSFEPNRSLAEAIRQSAELNGFADRVHVVQAGAGRRRSWATLLEGSPENIGRWQLELGAEQGHAGVDRIEIVTLDSVAYDLPVSVIKIDVEGMETQVLHGAAKLIARDRPAIYCEAKTSKEFRNVYRILDGFDYMLVGTFNRSPTHLFLPRESSEELRKVEHIRHLELKNAFVARSKIARLRSELREATRCQPWQPGAAHKRRDRS
ncbi:hypothetical protein OG2516_18700 [Oceanicola granulosus HTCC2516]|uniref:FkbM family methyltransferase n=1 Tax=Oceanicola granulosus (strain ATCC BAA-861 / DSM 15982 / KCTC 12143 / HTCC2516) TaxID=314256 RepID=Q2CHB6_OCEGH|nr:FkbM family methyltransferase [Oceanicola granulosus]EAR52123.1 hypothetical protein OG2516_18700 [Oceanicola granulosus HTCC2516]